MDDRRFEAVSRVLARGLARRRLAGVAAALVSVLFADAAEPTSARGRGHGRNRGNGHGNGRNRKGKRGDKDRGGNTSRCKPTEVRVGRRCVACDVCPNGCAFDEVRAAVAAAAPGAVVQLCPGSYAIPTSPRLTIATDLELMGAGAGKTVLDGGGSGRSSALIQVDSGGSLRLRGLTVTGGNNTLSGGIGGGIWIDNQAVVELDGVRIAGNRARTGGGIVNNGEVILDGGSVVEDNEASFEQGGGGILNNQPIPSTPPLVPRVTLRGGSVVSGNVEAGDPDAPSADISNFSVLVVDDGDAGRCLDRGAAGTGCPDA